MSDALVVVTLDGRITFWNRGAERMFGFAREKAIGRALVDLIVPPESRDETLRLIATASAEDVDTFESVRTRRDGTVIY
ncbi:MAG TPA: PAS domain S-box protein, partial [Gemmatimonadaceae bacterium]|nr:PAS domain S-box protein [Gemmatimonadaceae bacterium]